MHFHRNFATISHPVFDEESAANNLVNIGYKVYNPGKRKIFAVMVIILHFCTGQSHRTGKRTGRNLSRPRLITALRKPAQPLHAAWLLRLLLTLRLALGLHLLELLLLLVVQHAFNLGIAVSHDALGLGPAIGLGHRGIRL